MVENEKRQSSMYSIAKYVRRIVQPKIETIRPKLSRWYKKQGLDNLFKRNHLLIPVNKKQEHWSLVIICNLQNLKKISTGEVQMENLPAHEKPMILYLDSLLPLDDAMPVILRMYLESEIKSILGETYPVNEEDESDKGIQYLIDEHTLPCYQVLVRISRITIPVSNFFLGSKTKKSHRLWNLRAGIHGEVH